MKMQIVLHYVPTGKCWFGNEVECTQEEVDSHSEFFKEVVQAGEYLTMELQGGRTCFLGKNILKDCAIYIDIIDEGE